MESRCAGCEKTSLRAYKTIMPCYYYVCFECMMWYPSVVERRFGEDLSRTERGRWKGDGVLFNQKHSDRIEEEYQKWVDEMARKEIVGDE